MEIPFAEKWNARFPRYRIRHYSLGPGMIVIYILAVIGVATTIWRWFFGGLGQATNLSDGRPWGLWVGFDLLVGISISAGAFSIVAIVYLFNLKKFYPIVRPTLLTGFLAYFVEALSVMADLGQPQRIFYMIFHWNVHSPLLLVGWCVMLYLVVVLLEFSPVIFEWLGLKAPLKLIRKITIPIIVAAVTIAVVHQSALGILMTIMPWRIHPLWYSPLFPLYFLITAIASGLAMTVFESYHSARTYGFPFELSILKKLTSGIPWALGIYFVIRMVELGITGKFGLLAEGGLPFVMFVIEMIVGVVIPILYFTNKRMRNNHKHLVWGAFFTIVGLILYRFNLALIFFDGAPYFPSLAEIAITVGLSCLGIAIYDLAVRFLPMFPEVPHKVIAENTEA